MTETLNLAQLLAQAEAAGADFKKVQIPPDTYRVEITHAKYNASKAGNPGYSVRTVVKEGPYAGKGFWSNFYLTPIKRNGEPNNAGVAMFFRGLEALGVSTEEFKTGQTTIEQVVSSNRLVGVVADATVEDNEFNDEVSSKVKQFKAVKTNAAAAVPQTYVSPPPPAVGALTAEEPF